MLYFPYCTEDVFAGRHTAMYRFGIKVQHRGYSNVLKTLTYLRDKNHIDYDLVTDAVIYGASAGGIATLFHAPNIDNIPTQRC
jgi:hypothetical protein